MIKYILAIDPGIGTGYALFDERRLKSKDNPYNSLIFTGNCAVKNDKTSYESRMFKLCTKVVYRISQDIEGMHTEKGIKEDFEVRVIIERPSSFKSQGGQVCTDSGALVKLAMCAGALGQALKQCNFMTRVKYVDVNSWKGQMTKDQTTMRICKIMRLDTCPWQDHEIDAIGIGLNYGGKL